MKNFLAGFISCALISILIYSLMPERQDAYQNHPVPTAPVAAAPAEFLLKKLQLLERENIDLKQRLESYSPQNIASPSTISEQAPAEADVLAKVYAKHAEEFQRATDFSLYTNRLEARGQTMLNDLAEKFTAEPVDDTWAPTYQQKISRIFTDVDSLQKMSPSAIECRTNKCRITIPATDSDEANQMTAAFANAIYNNQFDIAQSDVIATPDFSKGVLTLYIAKNNNHKAYE